jgi:hypothetical protein
MTPRIILRFAFAIVVGSAIGLTVGYTAAVVWEHLNPPLQLEPITRPLRSPASVPILYGT